jgi:hypothetical protein
VLLDGHGTAQALHAMLRVVSTLICSCAQRLAGFTQPLTAQDTVHAVPLTAAVHVALVMTCWESQQRCIWRANDLAVLDDFTSVDQGNVIRTASLQYCVQVDQAKCRN